MPGKSITVQDVPEAVSGRLLGFCRTNPAGIGITVEEESAPRGLIYFRVHCGNKKSASAKLELRLEQGKCVIGWGYRQGVTVFGQPGNLADLHRCKDFCAAFLQHLENKYPPAPQDVAREKTTTARPASPGAGAGANLWLDYYEAMNAAGYPYTLKDVGNASSFTYNYIRKLNARRGKNAKK